MEEILKIGFSMVSASIFTMAVVLLIHLGILNRTLHEIKEHLNKENDYRNRQGDGDDK